MPTKRGEEAAAEIEVYLASKEPGLIPLVTALRAFVRSIVPGAEETVNPWGVPTFDYHGPMCYLSVASRHVDLGFLRGTSLSDPENLLEGTGKNLRHAKLRSVEDLQEPGLRELVAAAAALNEAEPQTGMPRTGKNTPRDETACRAT